MREIYKAWIRQNYPDYESAYGHCAEATEAMVRAFPELRRASGFYHCPVIGERTHWWCVDPDGGVVDPTAKQFPSNGQFEYQELVQGRDPIPSGKCPNCGGWCYDGAYLCSDACHAEYAAYCSNPNAG